MGSWLPDSLLGCFCVVIEVVGEREILVWAGTFYCDSVSDCVNQNSEVRSSD